MPSHLFFLALLVLSLGSIFVLAAAAPATAPASDSSRVPPLRQPDKQVVFKTTPQGDLKLHIYLPPDFKATDKRPAVVFFFGGGWRIGNPSQFFSKSEYFASRGMVAICAEYRIASVHNTSIREAVIDARSAVRYLRKNAGDWGIDPDKIVAGGGSAGGHIAATLLLDSPDDPADDLKVSCKPAALVLFNPVVDLLAAYEAQETRPIMAARAPGATDDEKKKYLAEFSPSEHLARNSPPTLIFFGDRDGFLLGARSYAKKSAALGNQVQIFTAPNIGHGFFNAEPWHAATLIKTDEFLATLGYLNGPPTIKPASDSAVLSADKPTN